MAQGLAQALASTAARRAPALAGGAAAAGAAHSAGTNAPGALALALGAAGLVPFLALAPHGDAALPLPEWVSERRVALQKSYGACILSFLGGIHWGFATAGAGAASARLAYSVVPSLVAWPALAAPRDADGLKLLLGGLCGCLAADVALAAAAAPALPAWYMPLRLALTAGAGASLGATLCELEPSTCGDARAALAAARDDLRRLLEW